MDTSLKVLLVAFAIIAVARSEQNSTKKNPVKSGTLMLDYNWPRMKAGLTRFPHQSSCYHFYSPDSEGQFKLRKCPTGLMFDYRSLKCGRETLSQCWSSQFDRGYKPLYHRKHFHCPLPWGRYPDILNCKRYFQCRAKKALHRTCPNFTLFDKTKNRCVPQTLAICSDKAEVEKYYKCPHSRGLFMYSKDCSKYHKCRQRISKLRSCKLGYLFDSKRSRCLPKDEVVCGNRYNPYNQSDDATTTDSDFQPSTRSSQNFLMTTSPKVATKTSNFSTNTSTEFPDASFEISDEGSSEEQFNLTYDIATDDFSDELLSGITDSDIDSSTKEHLMGTAEVAHGNSSLEFAPRTAETEHERSSASTSRAIDEDFKGRVVTIDGSNSSTEDSTETAHRNSSEYLSLGTVEVTQGNSSRDLSVDTAGTTNEIPSQDISRRTAITSDENSLKDLSTGTAYRSSSGDFSSGTVPSDSYEDLSTEIAETVPFIKEISDYKADNLEEFQEEPFVNLVSVKNFA